MESTLANVLFMIAGLLWGIELLPQIFKTERTKCVKDMSLFFYLICFLAYTLYMIGALLIRNYWIFLAHIPSLLFLIIMISLMFKYRKNK